MLKPYLTCRNFAELVPKQVNHIAKNFGIHGTFGVKEPLGAMEIKRTTVYVLVIFGHVQPAQFYRLPCAAMVVPSTSSRESNELRV